MNASDVTRRSLLGLAATFIAGPAYAAPVCGSPNSDGAVLCTMSPALVLQAKCNDGSIPMYWLRPGYGSGATHWVIWLEGGGQCIDQQSCASRAVSAPRYLTSSGFSAGIGQGILSSNPSVNPLLYNANTVLVHYCSSDWWSGSQASSGSFDPQDTATWNFQGRAIALAAVGSLARLNLNFQGATQILLGGGSSGGVGVAVTANDILPILPPAQDVRVIEDAGFAMNIGQYDAAAASPYVHVGRPNAFDNLFEAGISLWHGSGDAVCAAAAQTRQDQVACYSSAVFQNGYIQVPVFVAESQLDTAQLSDELCPKNNGNCALPHDPMSMQGVYAAAFAASMAATLTGASGAAWSVFSPNFYAHDMLANANFVRPYAFPGGSLAARDVLNAWLQTDGTSRIVALGDAPGVQGPTRSIGRLLAGATGLLGR